MDQMPRCCGKVERMNPKLPKLPPRTPDSHKGDFGRVLLIGGSREMPGSISLSGMAALRSGAGLVTVAVPAAAQPIVAGFEPSYMTAALADDANGRVAMAGFERACELIAHATVVAVGPGLGQSSDVIDFVTTLFRETPLPMVVDADGLNALAARRDSARGSRRPACVDAASGRVCKIDWRTRTAGRSHRGGHRVGEVGFGRRRAQRARHRDRRRLAACRQLDR